MNIFILFFNNINWFSCDFSSQNQLTKYLLSIRVVNRSVDRRHPVSCFLFTSYYRFRPTILIVASMMCVPVHCVNSLIINKRKHDTARTHFLCPSQGQNSTSDGNTLCCLWKISWKYCYQNNICLQKHDLYYRHMNYIFIKKTRLKTTVNNGYWCYFYCIFFKLSNE